MTYDVRALATQIVARSTAAQGLPFHVEDESTLAYITDITRDADALGELRQAS